MTLTAADIMPNVVENWSRFCLHKCNLCQHVRNPSGHLGTAVGASTHLMLLTPSLHVLVRPMLGVALQLDGVSRAELTYST